MSSQTVLSACLSTLMKDVSEALKFDRQERNEDAYKKYLECVLRVSTGLLKTLYTDEGHVFVTKDIEKMVKLGQQCMDRVASIVNQRLEKAPKSSIQTPTNLPLNSGPGPLWSRSQSTPTTPVTRETTPVTPNRPPSVTDATLTSTLDSMSSSTTRKLGPMEIAARQNQHLLIALRKRQAMAKNKSASANLSLTLQRKMVENLAIARAQEEALAKKMKERQQRLEEQAARRFHTPVGLSEEEQQQRQVYKKVLEFEQENLWMMELRKKFEESPADIYVISELITAVLSCDAHPLTVELQVYQRTMLDKLIHLVKEKLNKVEKIKVPLPRSVYEDSNLKDFKVSFQKVKPGTKLARSESSLDTVQETDSTYGSLSKSQDVSNVDSDIRIVEDQDVRNLDEVNSEDNEPMADLDTKDNDIEDFSVDTDSVKYSNAKDLADVSAEIKRDIEKAVIDGSKLKTKLEEENQRLKSFSRQATEEYEKYNQENMDDLFDDDSDMEDKDADNNNSDSDDNKTVQDDSVTCEKENESDETSDLMADKLEAKTREASQPKVLRKNPSFENLYSKIAQLKNEAYHRHLKGMTEDILTSIERLQVLFVIVFEQLDSAEGRDQCNVLLERYFFKPIWKYLLVLFRLANEPKEIALAFIMTENQSCTPETFAVREKLCLGDYPYQSAVTELEGVIQCHTMLEKLDCLVRASKEVMHCVEQYYKQRDTEAPSLGADDLLPILCYVVVRSGLPQLVSECQAMEKLIHEGYMFGEEGYCLTSFQTAINYLISEGVGNQET
ncbi:VPS9 domain-containing protein 1-like [Mercenaria mercenaria]|uniref:VPS9 domain-containing protein 1-like n=1 Tax=Mercenaria mercenaria TaxID=6596 RepID=UPI00234E8A83|nr:VPS9 domain-containing protein 1-like [Mercenaria mercenaria]